jgi:S-adenosylmethionine:tRNA ribosyltransferase-isomerase
MGSALDAYDFVLPPEQIAQAPLARRDASRLMLLRRGQPGWRHAEFTGFLDALPPGAVLVFNNTRVIPARLTGEREGGYPVEALLVDDEGEGRWRAMVKPARRLKPGQRLRFAHGLLPARCVERVEGGLWRLEFEDPATFRERLEQGGTTPLPPYIRRPDLTPEQEHRDREVYQTVYASRPGAVAAPTAGLHFTPELLQHLDRSGFERLEITLHVGPGTFAPVQVDDPAQHHMHSEPLEIAEPVAVRLVEARKEGRPVIAIGTTAVRSLEAWARAGTPRGYAGTTDLFIYPPFEFRSIDGMLTNFHLPKSTLLMLVSAFHGRERVLAAYGEAVARGYRFFSFGDAMLILP